MAAVIETICDATAIKLLNKHTILIGRGNELHLFIEEPVEGDVNSLKEQKLEIDFNNKIHGIEATSDGVDNVIVVFGGREFSLAAYDCKYKLNVFHTAQLTDWINSGVFLEHCEQLVLLTAHNVALRFEYNAEQHSCQLIDRVCCIDKSNVYCTKLYGNAWNELIVFAGNAFGELLIWQPHEQINFQQDSKQHSKAISMQPLHSGAIFSIDYDGRFKQLLTAGDDRSVKWWQVESNTSDSDHNFWHEVNLKPITSSYGHTARVFHCRFIIRDDVLFALSAGEDSLICLWNNKGELLFKRCQQFGAAIWKLAYNQETETVFTVGSTGNLTAFGLKDLFSGSRNTDCVRLTLATISNVNNNEYIAKIRFLNPSKLLGITNKNRIVMLTAGQSFSTDDVWKAIGPTINFKCTVMEVYKNFVAICGYKRLLIMTYLEDSNEFSVLHDDVVLNGIIRKFIFFQADKYLISDDIGNCRIVINQKSVDTDFQLPKAKESWLTAALLLNDDQNLIVSNRLGHLLLYKFYANENRYQLKQIIRNVHGNLGATNLYLNFKSSSDRQAFVYSIGHDNAINCFNINLMNCVMSKCSRDTIPVAWAEAIIQHHRLNDVIFGFNNNNFVVWSRDYDFQLQLPCGGGHRSWHYILSNDGKSISLLFIKSKQVLFHHLPLYNMELLTLSTFKNWHRAPCNIMQIYADNELCGESFAVAAGDDNLLKIFSLSAKGLKFQTELYCHYSNVRALKVMHFAESDYLIFSGGGRSQFCISQINAFTFLKTELVNCTLKLQAIAKVNTKLKTANQYNLDTDMRIMAIDVMKVSPSLYTIYAACSDGYLRLLHFIVDTLQIKIHRHLFLAKCITHVKVVPEWNYVIVAVTDGKLRIYDNSLNACLLELTHHSSSISAMSILYNHASNELQILTGGDDEVVAYSQIQLSSSYESFHIMQEFRQSSWHNAQVTAVFIEPSGLYAFTSGVDQLVYKIDLQQSEVLERFHSCIADVKGLAWWFNSGCNYILIYGCGYQMITFDPTSDSTKSSQEDDAAKVISSRTMKVTSN